MKKRSSLIDKLLYGVAYIIGAILGGVMIILNKIGLISDRITED